MFNVLDSVISIQTKRVQHSAAAFGGYCTWPFSQALNPVRSLMGQNPDSKKGICEMLAAKWLEEHAKGGSLVEWLTGGDGKRKGIDPSKVRLLMQYYIVGATMPSGAMVGAPQDGYQDQVSATAKWLRQRGILERKISMVYKPDRGGYIGRSRPAEHTGQASGSGAQNQLGQAMSTVRDCYVMILISGSASMGHAMCAWVGDDVAFLDPNYGEFWFQRKADFVRWLPAYLSKAFYGPMRMLDQFSMKEYALAAGKWG